MTVKEKMIEVFGEEKVEDLIKALRPSNIEQRVEVYSPSYVKLLEFLLDEYKDPNQKCCNIVPTHQCSDDMTIDISKIPETADPLSQPVNLQSRWSPEAYAAWKKNKEAKAKIENEEYNTVTEVPVKHKNSLVMVGNKNGKLDNTWYKNQVEDFYLSEQRIKTFKLTDDKSDLKKVNTVDGLKIRFMTAVKDANLGEYITVHKYYANTTNECVALENVTVAKNSAETYKYS